MRYLSGEGNLSVAIERARNLSALGLGESSQVYVKATLLPGPVTCCTQMVKDLRKPTFGDVFTVPVPANKIFTKTLQVTVWNVREQGERCVGCTHISLADFNPKGVSEKWYNLISQSFMEPIEESRLSSHAKQESEMSIRQSVTKEESSDDSTIISSQTSTLTRNQDCESFQAPINVKYEELVSCLQNVSCDSEDSDDDDEEDDEEDDDEEEEGMVTVEFRPNEKLEVVLEDCAGMLPLFITKFIYHTPFPLSQKKNTLTNKPTPSAPSTPSTRNR